MPNTQAAIAATIAYLICAYLWRQPNPVFAAVSCYLALGFSRNRQPRRVLEIGVGVSFGVLIGELAARAIGFGWWQLLLILLVTPLLARMMDRSDLMTFQSAINAMVVAALAALATQHDLPHSSVGRWVDSLTGALVGLVAAVVFPTSITTRPRRYTSTAMHRLGEALEAMGKGLSRGDAELVSAAQGYLDEARRQLTDGQAAQSSAGTCSNSLACHSTRRAPRSRTLPPGNAVWNWGWRMPPDSGVPRRSRRSGPPTRPARRAVRAISQPAARGSRAGASPRSGWTG